jgi:hypothetical protein
VEISKTLRRDGGINPWNNPEYRARMIAIHKERFKHAAAREQAGRNFHAQDHTKKWKRRRSQASKNMWLRDDYRNRNSQIHLDGYASGKVKPIARGVLTHTKKGGDIYCHGGKDPENNREKLFAFMLDASDKVVSFEKDYLRIPYFFEGKYHTYFPDFYVRFKDGTRVVFELIKFFVKQTVSKHEAAEEYCLRKGWRFVLIYSDDLDYESKCINIFQKYL